MKTRFAVGLLCALGWALASPAWAAPEIMKTEKLSFAPGSTELSTQGAVQGKAVVDYKVFVPKGKLLAVGVVADIRELYFNVLAPDGTTKIFDGTISGNQSEDAAPQDGEYIVRVYLAGRAMQKIEPIRFRLQVRIRESAG